MARKLQLLTEPLVAKNPVTSQVLGVCSALAVTTSLSTSLAMAIALTAVLALSSLTISVIRHHIPRSIRLILQITIIASLVIVVDQVLQAYFFQLSQRLSVFVGLVVTNCVILGRAEAFALRNPPLASVLDGLGNGLGYGAVLLLVGALRELLGAGTFFERVVFTPVDAGGMFQPLGFMLQPASAFFILGLLVWVMRSLRPEQAERADYALVAPPPRVVRGREGRQP